MQPVFAAVHFQHRRRHPVGAFGHVQHQIAAQNAAERPAVGRHLFTGRQEGERGGQHVRRRGDQRRQRRAACQVAGDRLAVGLHDEHAPVARVVGGDRFLLDHDLVKTGNIVQIVGDGQRLLADLPPLGGETFGVGEQRGAVEHRLALNAAIVNIAQCEHDQS